MSVSITKHPLENFAYKYESINTSRNWHSALMGGALILSLVVTLVILAVLKNGDFSLGFAMSGNCAVAATAGIAVFSIAISGLLLHYKWKNNHKQQEADEHVLA